MVRVVVVTSYDTYQVDNLLESHTKCDHDGRGLVDDGPVLGVVVLQKICQQFLLIGSPTTTYNIFSIKGK